jgi:DNA-binding beta-propeller fold protein YncE
MLGSSSHIEAAPLPQPVRIGSGYWTYELVPGWGAAPGGIPYGWGCGVVVDSRDRVYVHSRRREAVVVYDRHGKPLTSWGAEYAGTGHGLYWHKDGPDEFLYFTDPPRNLVVKTDLSGKPLMRIGAVSEENGDSIRFDFNQPTDLAVAPNGDIYVCEGYGGQRIHRFTAEGKHLQTTGSPGSGPEQFNICHGIWVDTRKRDPEVYIADRANGRIQVFTPDLKIKRSLSGDVRKPCCFYQQHGNMFIPDLDHRVTVLDEHDQAVAQLGDGWTKDDTAVFRAPHAVALDSHGDLYVVEWVDNARIRKFRHMPQSAA